MSIGKRLFNFARSELNSLLDRAAELDDPNEPSSGDGDGEPRATPPESTSRRPGRKVRLEDLSDEELEAEIERRRLDREIDERAARASTSTAHEPRRERPSASPPRTPRTPSDPIARAYAALEVPQGSDFETVRKAYRNLMRKYHPDRHTASPEKQKAANELAQKLTDAYKTLEKRLRR
ncbi:MAG TPA: DnaJ domain-containing protein [Polyangia bacterium]